MEKQFSIDPNANGQAIWIDDVNLLGEVGALADDRVLWELLRLPPGSATRGILPYGKAGWRKESGSTSTALIQPDVGGVRVMPFRAVVGSTATSGSELEELRGQRSGYLVGSSTQHTSVSLNPNASGNPRWTLIYAVVTPNAQGSVAKRTRKGPTTSIVTKSDVVLFWRCAVTLSTADGAATAPPPRPALPSDVAGNYCIPLGFVWVPGGFGTASVVDRKHIHTHAPCLPIHSSMGVSNIRPANQSFGPGGTVDVRQSGSAFVFAVVDREGKLVVERRLVQLGALGPRGYIVDSGLAAGARIAVSSLQMLRDGAPVTVRKAFRVD